MLLASFFFILVFFPFSSFLGHSLASLNPSPNSYATHLVDVAVGAGANLLDELVLVLRIASRDVRAEQIGIVVAVGGGHFCQLGPLPFPLPIESCGCARICASGFIFWLALFYPRFMVFDIEFFVGVAFYSLIFYHSLQADLGDFWGSSCIFASLHTHLRKVNWTLAIHLCTYTYIICL